MTLKLKASVDRRSGYSLDVDIEFPNNAITALYGPSGAGKSTILKIIAGIADRNAMKDAHVAFRSQTWQTEERFIPAHQRRIGYVFQDLQLFDHLTVAGNLAFAADRREGTTEEDYIREMLDIEHLLQQPIARLSGGERQRVAIARALYSNPQLLLLDEPLGSIDAAARTRILPFLKEMQVEFDLPIVYVSHAIEEVNYLADHVVVLTNGKVSSQGSILDFTSDLLRGAEEPNAAAVIRCTVVEDDAGFDLVIADFEGYALYLTQSQAGYRQDDPLSVSVPARDVSIVRTKPEDSSILNLIPAVVEEIHDPLEGPSALVRLAIGGQFLLARITRRSLAGMELGVGEHVYAQIKGVALTSQLERFE